MSRGLSASVITELTAASIRPLELFECELNSQTLYLSSGQGNVSWNSETWLGNGWFRGIGNVREQGDIEAAGIEVLLTGIPSTLISALLGDVHTGLAGTVYLAFLNSSGGVISSPYELFSGRLDVPEIQEAEDGANISLSYESRLIELDKSKELRYTHNAQQALFSGDLGFEYLETLQNSDFFWGVKKAKKKRQKNRRRRGN